jgi:hypothetical protein
MARILARATTAVTVSFRREVPMDTDREPPARAEALQLDLFAHGRDVILRNGVSAALRRRDAAGAREALAALCSERPGDRLLAPFATLLEAVAAPAARFAGHRQAAAALRAMESEIVPAAAEVFGEREAAQWLAASWRALAAAAERLPWDGDFPHTHSAALLLRSRDWEAAEARASAIPSWRHIPMPLAWMAEARFGRGGLECAWDLLAELAWIDAPRFGALARRLPSAPLQRLLEDFDAGFQTEDEAGLAWFPAWALVAEPGLALPFRDARACGQTAPERAARLVASLLVLERQGRHAELVAQRKRLRELQPVLFARYMATR